MRRPLEVILCSAGLLCAACQTGARFVGAPSPEAQLVRDALARWPLPTKGTALKRPFFATIHAAGMRTTASGMLEYHGSRDFRVTAVTEMGVILFDGRVNWAGATVIRQMPGLDATVIETLLSDLTRGFELPADLAGLKAADDKLALELHLADTHRYTWTFSRDDGRLLQTDVNLGLFDTLRITFRKYTPAGWPEEMQVVRKARLYDVSFSFTDKSVAQSSPVAETRRE
jgi:hypothetical protein